jgi:membrane protease YdiL (CAAX protease family)
VGFDGLAGHRESIADGLVRPALGHHLPVAFISLGVLTIPYLVAVHTALGFVLVTSWRRTGNLAAPGIAHAVTDALRNAVAVL